MKRPDPATLGTAGDDCDDLLDGRSPTLTEFNQSGAFVSFQEDMTVAGTFTQNLILGLEELQLPNVLVTAAARKQEEQGWTGLPMAV